MDFGEFTPGSRPEKKRLPPWVLIGWTFTFALLAVPIGLMGMFFWAESSFSQWDEFRKVTGAERWLPTSAKRFQARRYMDFHGSVDQTLYFEASSEEVRTMAERLKTDFGMSFHSGQLPREVAEEIAGIRLAGVEKRNTVARLEQLECLYTAATPWGEDFSREWFVIDPAQGRVRYARGRR